LVCDIQCLFSFISHVEFFRTEVTSKIEYTNFSVVIEKETLHVIIRKVKGLLKLFRIRAIEEYLNLHNKNKIYICVQNILVINNVRLN